MRDWNDVRDEVGDHVADLRRDALRRGCTVEEADRLAAAELARLDVIAGACRQRNWWTGSALDLGHAWRLLRRQRGYSLLVIATLAIAIGGCTAVYSLFHALILQPLPFPHAERLVLLWECDADDPNLTFVVAAPNYADWVAMTRSFQALGIWAEMTFNVSATSEPEQVAGLRTSSSLFSVLGVAPQLGRVFTTEEDERGHAVAIISDAVWKSHFSGRHDVLGQSIRLNGELHHVVGVMPPGFEFPYRGAGVWVPIAFTQQDQERGAHSFWVAGRLNEGVTFQQARDEVERFGVELRGRHPENAGEGATATLMSEYGARRTRSMLNALAGAVALVLVIACVNVAGLQLALGLARRREFATRLSLGGTYARLGRQVIVEALVVAALACAAGLAIAWMATRAFGLLLPPGFLNLLFRGDVTITLVPAAVIFAIAVALISAVVFAFAPLWGIRRPSLHALLRDGARGATRASRVRRVLVAAEIALAVIVLAGAGLLTKSLASLLSVDAGVDATNVLTLRVSLPQADTYGRPERVTFCQNLAREVASVPGVTKVSAISHLPFSGANASRSVTIEGRPEPAPDAGAIANYRLSCPGYFSTLGIPIVAGRDFTYADVVGREDVVIISRAFAERHWPEGTAVGERLKIGGFQSTNPWLTVVGISENVRHFGLEAPPTRDIFRPYAQSAWPVMTVVAKTATDPMTWERPVRQALARVEAQLPAAGPRAMADVMRRSLGWREAPMRLLNAFAMIGLLLAAVGVYSVLAYNVSQRSREFGIRTALGASKPALVLLVLRQSVAPLAIGLAIGLAGSFVTGRLLSELLFEVRLSDPLVLGTVVAILIAVALVSSWWPARRAAAVDPLIALRDE